MKIVVTGAEGLLGGALCRDAELVGLDLPEFDLADRDSVLDGLLRIGPDAVINTAAYTQVDRAEDEPELCRKVNAEGVAYLVEACRRLDAVLVQLSTDYVFGRDSARRVPYREIDVPGPLGVYGRSKLEGEQRAAQWPKHFIVRTAWLHGHGGPRSAGNFVDRMLDLARKKTGSGTLRVVDDQHGTPCYAPHVARAIRFLLSTKAYGTYHVVNQGQTTWFRLAEAIFRLTRLDVDLMPISTAEYVQRAPRPTYGVLDASRYHALPGRPTMPDWQDALAEHISCNPR